MYRTIIYPFLSRWDAERSHEGVLRLLELAESQGWLRRALARVAPVYDPRLEVELLGLRFANPLGVAAGLDKNAVAVQTWGALGFGHVEVGTVTPRPQPGNPRPRVFRLPEDQALINRMGFPGSGAEAVAARLKRRGATPLVGVNLGANKSSVDAGSAVDDYVAGLEQLHAMADYVAINVSSPNTARLRELQGAAALTALVGQLLRRRDELANGARRVPVLLKIAPDLEPAELDAIVDVCLNNGVDGIIATNTTVGRPKELRAAAVREAGGLSGAPLRRRSTDIVRYLRLRSEGQLPIIGVGGVFGASDVVDKLAAGASLVQIYTGLVYGGPLLARHICRELGRMMDALGCRTVAELGAAKVVNNEPTQRRKDAKGNM